MFGLELANLKLNRKMLSELAINEPYSFKAGIYIYLYIFFLIINKSYYVCKKLFKSI